jgi:hypothetical protein
VGCVLLLAAAVALAGGREVSAHEIPTDVLVQALLRPEDRTLRVIVRVPLTAMRDVELPTRGPGYLEIARADATLRDAATLWIGDALAMFEEGDRLGYPRVVAARVSLPSDRSLATWDAAVAHVTGPPLPDAIDLHVDQALLDILFEYDIASDRSRFAIDPGLARLGLQVTTVLRYLPPGGAERAFQLHGDPGLVHLDPRWHQAAVGFVVEGFFHILDGIDHLLFLLCLVIPIRRFSTLIGIVTAFTVAHSVTLIASARGLAPDALWFPPLVEALIALSIVYMAMENIVAAAAARGPGRTAAEPAAPFSRRRWLIAFGFGLVHGFGFSFALRETLQLAGSHVLTSLVAFNVGVELGQLAVLLVLVPALGLLFRFVVVERVGTIVLSALVAHTGWHWMVERGALLRQYRFEWPAFDLLLLAAALRWLIVLAMAGALAWGLSLAARAWQRRAAADRASGAADGLPGATEVAPSDLLAPFVGRDS